MRLPSFSEFIVLIDRRPTGPAAAPTRPWLRWSLATLTAAALALGSTAWTAAHAQGFSAMARAQLDANLSQGKIARDLHSSIVSTGAGAPKWVREVRGQRHVQMIVVADSSDPELTDLRRQVEALGGTVHARLGIVRGLSVQLPADKVGQLASRSDVASLSPNRPVRRSASALEAVSGLMTTGVRSYSSSTSYSGLDGSGVGIAVLDSGIMPTHRSFQNASGVSRVVRAIDTRNANLADWTAGTTDGRISPAPGSAELSAYEMQLRPLDNLDRDPHGHGTHVASVAAGRGFYQNPTAPASPRAPRCTTCACSAMLAKARSATCSKASSG